MKEIVLLGSSGFIGRHLTSKIMPKFQIKSLQHKSKIDLKHKIFSGNILESGILDKIIHDDAIIVNLIGQYNGDFTNFIDVNFKGGLNILNSAILKKNIKLILISSIDVYGESLKIPSTENDELNPITLYGVIKSLTEKLYENFARIYGLDITIIRLSHVYGKDKKSGIIGNLIKSLFEKNSISINHNGKQYRDFIHIDDAVDGIVRIIQKQKKGFHIVNICSGKKYTPLKIIQIIKNLSGDSPIFELNDDKSNEKCVWADNKKAINEYDFLPKYELGIGLKQQFF